MGHIARQGHQRVEKPKAPIEAERMETVWEVVTTTAWKVGLIPAVAAEVGPTYELAPTTVTPI